MNDNFGAAFPTAHVLACLRINRSVAAPTARLTADLPGSAVIGRDLHPLGSELNFMKSPHDSLLSDRHCLVATRKLSRGVCDAQSCSDRAAIADSYCPG
jgi:hypothetical protein